MASLPDNVRVLLDGPNIANLATVLPTGAPHSVPVWVGLEDQKIAFLTSPSSRKARNLAGDPRVAISVTDREQPHWMAQVLGRVSERIEGDPAWVTRGEWRSDEPSTLADGYGRRFRSSRRP